jgi:conjugative transposon TraM protein
MIREKLQQLTQHLDQSAAAPSETTTSSESATITATTSETPPPIRNEHLSGDVDRLEKMMQLMTDNDINDPEMQQIEGLIDKILDLQHPERIRNRIGEEQHLQHEQQNIFSVEPARDDNDISFVETPVVGLSDLPEVKDPSIGAYPIRTIANGFYGLDDGISPGLEALGSIQAAIHNTQTVVAGSTIKMRLLTDITINGQLMQKDQFIYGTCAINGERLTISVNSIRDENALLPVSLTVHDLDGMEGIYIPGAITRDVARQAADQSVQDIQLYSMDNSLGVQAATAGIEAAKGLFSKKAKLIKVTVKAGYQVLLRDTNPALQ